MAASAPNKRVLVAGAGISGLAAAYHIRNTRPEVEVLLVEPRRRTGGNIETERRDGFLLDGGPDSFLRTKPEAARLCEQLGLGEQLTVPLPTAHRTYVGQKGRLVPLPAGMALAVPTRLGPLVRTPLLGWSGKLRVLLDLFAEQRPPEGDETVASFLTRHFGRDVTEQLAGPLLGGIFAGDIEELSIRSTFPQLVELERKQGSLIRALFAAERARAAQAQGKATPRSEDAFDPVELWSLFGWLRREAKSVPSPFQSLSGGMGTLVHELTRRLPEQALRLGRRIERLEQASDRRWRVQLDADTVEVVDGVVSCMPAFAAADALDGYPVSQVLRQVPYVSTATVFFALAREPKQQSLDGAGFIVPRKEGRVLASTWISSKWGARAPEGAVLLRAFLGGAREPDLVEKASDDELLTIARDELTRFMGSLEPVLFTRVFRWHRSNPQPTVGHAARIAKIESFLRDAPALEFAGFAYDGVGIPDCIRRGRAAADAVLRQL
jgi:oxygen-dependent protoporphyrinogen oxidase